ncbi:type II secretion system F family protein [Brachybacterium sp. EF45031]|uniref:type II secretion system F family protein n=1 Tax=Brachybacterium sillae TaxID=2810536 RepID=UPI00217CFEED|nr:type II secretion system F family protein [Brachybacterium sillae]MCS6712148.1 type II secretion system F family protein [Brachybacterium sillae]
MSAVLGFAALTTAALLLIVLPAPGVAVPGGAPLAPRGSDASDAAEPRGSWRALLGGREPAAREVSALVERLLAVQRTGAAPRRVWEGLLPTTPLPLRPLARALAGGIPAAELLHHPTAQAAPVRTLLTALALCERTGAPLGGVLSSLVAALEDLDDAELARRSAFAGPRATAGILAILPVVGVGLGTLIGASPVTVLLRSSSGPVLLVAGAALTGCGWWWMHRLMRASRGTSEQVDPTVVLDLVAAPLSAGLPLGTALQEVAACLPESSWRGVLLRSAAALRAGADPAHALRDLPASLAPLRDAWTLAERSGADPSGMLRAAARASRRTRARDAEAEAARLAVRLVLPTGLALLPAFLLLGIVPTVISLLGGSFGDLLGGAPATGTVPVPPSGG